MLSKIKQRINNYVQSKLEDYLLYTEIEKARINSFINRIEDTEFKKGYSWNEKSSVLNTRHLLVESQITYWWRFKIFFLSNENLKYRSLREDLLNAKRANKFIIFVLLGVGEIDLKNEFQNMYFSKLIIFNEICESESNNVSLKHIKTLIHEPNILLQSMTKTTNEYIKEIQEKSDYYSFTLSEKLKINQFIQTIAKEKYSKLFQWRKSLQIEKEELNETFNDSKFSLKLFILTKEKLESEYFKIEYESSISLNKIQIFLLLEEIDLDSQNNLDRRRTIIFDDTNNNQMQYELFKILLDREFHNYVIKKTPIHEAKIKSEMEKFYQRIENEEENVKLVNWEKYLIDENENFKVFFITKDTLNGDNFKIENKLALIEGKIVIYVFVENFEAIIEISDGIIIAEPIESESNDEAFKILKRLLFNLLTDTVKDYSRDLQPFSKEKLMLNEIIKIQKLSNNEMLLVQEGSAHVFNMETCTIVNKFKTKLEPYVIDHLNLILLIDGRDATLYDTNGKLNHFQKFTKSMRSVTYSNSNKKTYFSALSLNSTSTFDVFIYDSNFNFEKETSIDCAKYSTDTTIEFKKNFTYSLMCLGDKIFVFIEKSKLADEILVLDSNLNYFTSIQNVMRLKNMKNSIVYDQNEPNYFFLKINNSIQIFSTKYLSVIGVINNPYKLQAVYGSKLLFKYSDQFFIYKMNFMKKEKKFEDKFICKLDPFNTHLYKNPCKLPCGNSACFVCLWKNVFIDKNKFICCFDNCKQIQHSVQYKLPKDIQLQQALLDNINVLCGEVIEEFNETSYTVCQYEFIEKFETRFEIIEQNFELRIQSLFIKLDQLSYKMIDQVNLFEKKIISKPLRKPFRINIFSNKVFQISQIGSISKIGDKSEDKQMKSKKTKRNYNIALKNEELVKFVALMKNFF